MRLKNNNFFFSYVKDESKLIESDFVNESATDLSINYRLFIDSLVQINRVSDVKTNINDFLKRDFCIRKFKKNNYKQLHKYINISKEIANNEKIIYTFDYQKNLLESKNYYELIRKLIELRISKEKNLRKEFNIDLYLEVIEHFIRLSQRIQ